ncbi:hypothetical protein HX001_01105 [Empedobacter brevis]|uniref:Uncharacterized protein n=2 Tax=Empedobacter brevis TaxID=247 RepID=A0AAJ1QBU2_9FLAO|nr:hypothetical protein [Empedobacter brevis]
MQSNPIGNEIEQIDSEFDAMLSDFLANGQHEYRTVQTKVCYFIIKRIYRRVLVYGIDFGGIRIDITENLIIDGNHRYIAYKLAGFEFTVINGTKNHCDLHPFKSISSIKIDKTCDWDMNHKDTIKYCNDDFLEI